MQIDTDATKCPRDGLENKQKQKKKQMRNSSEAALNEPHYNGAE